MRIIRILLLLLTLPVYAETIRIPLQINFVNNLMEIPYQELLENGHPKFVGMYKQEGIICNIWLKKPKNWDDEFALTVLGHETYHCFKGPHTKEYLESHYE